MSGSAGQARLARTSGRSAAGVGPRGRWQPKGCDGSRGLTCVSGEHGSGCAAVADGAARPSVLPRETI